MLQPKLSTGLDNRPVRFLGVNNPVVGLDMTNLKEIFPINTCAALGFSKDHVAKLQARVRP
jgi:hypothetical protein